MRIILIGDATRTLHTAYCKVKNEQPFIDQKHLSQLPKEK
jgi:hypothetical protein